MPSLKISLKQITGIKSIKDNPITITRVIIEGKEVYSSGVLEGNTLNFNATFVYEIENSLLTIETILNSKLNVTITETVSKKESTIIHTFTYPLIGCIDKSVVTTLANNGATLSLSIESDISLQDINVLRLSATGETETDSISIPISVTLPSNSTTDRIISFNAYLCKSHVIFSYSFLLNKEASQRLLEFVYNSQSIEISTTIDSIPIQSKIDINSLLYPKTKSIHSTLNFNSHLCNLSLELKYPINTKTTSTFVHTIHDYIPRRNTIPHELYSNRSNESILLFRNELKTIIQSLSFEYSQHSDFYYHVNSSGAYFYFKERLKASVVQVIRKKFNKLSPFASRDELHTFISTVYVYLIEQVNYTVNQLFSNKTDWQSRVSSAAPHSPDLVDLLSFANECEELGFYDKSHSYHIHRMTLAVDKSDVWFDYALFCAKIRDFSKAEECLVQIISVHCHAPSLLFYACLCARNDDYEQSRTFMAKVIELEESATTWTVYGLVLELANEDGSACFDKAKEYCDGSIFLETSRFLLKSNVGVLLEKCLAYEVERDQVSALLCLSKLEVVRRNYDLAIGHVDKALQADLRNASLWMQKGIIFMRQSKSFEALISFEKALEFTKQYQIDEQHTLYFYLGQLYFEKAVGGETAEFGQLAFDFYCKSIQLHSTSRAWLGLGKLCLRLGKEGEAEDALIEANTLNNRDGEIWAYLALLSLRVGRDYESAQSLCFAFECGIDDEKLLGELYTQFAKAGMTKEADACLSKSGKAAAVNPDLKEAKLLNRVDSMGKSGRVAAV